MGQRRYYGVRARMKGVEIRMAEEFATCCGVNLAVGWFGELVFFLRALCGASSYRGCVC
jgi:hypothetical protein